MIFIQSSKRVRPTCSKASYSFRKYLSIFISSVLSGFCITISASVLLIERQSGHTEFGAFIFAFGLFVIVNFKLWLYTVKIGVVLDNKPSFLFDLLVCWVGNFVGDFILATMLKMTRISDTLKSNSLELVNDKLSDKPLSIFILSFMCGIMIYLAVQGHKVCEYPEGKVLFIVLGVAIFILTKHEPCIANGVYFIFAEKYNADSFFYMFLMIAGDSCGSVIFDLLLKIIKRNEQLNEDFNLKKKTFKEDINPLQELKNDSINSNDKNDNNTNTF